MANKLVHLLKTVLRVRDDDTLETHVQEMDITASAHRDAIVDKLDELKTGTATDVAKWGGTAQTGADLTPLFQNLDIALSALRDALQGAGSKDLSTLETAIGLLLAADTFTGRIGEVQADPTANTLLARLKTIGDKDFATQTTLALMKTALDSLLAAHDVDLSTRASEATLASIDTELADKLDEATFTGRIGEVQAAPTANTLLDRLKVIRDQLDVALSTRASEVTLVSLEGKDFATQATLASILAKLDVALSTRATEATLATRASEATLSAQLDIALSALRDAIAGAGAAARTQGELETAIDAVATAVAAVQARNVSQWGGTALTGRDVSGDLANLDLALTALRDAIAGVAPGTVGDLGSILDQLDVALSTRATEGTLATRLTESTFSDRVGEVQAAPTANTVLDRLKVIRDQLDAALSTRASEATLASVLAVLDVALSTRASEATLAAQLDVTLSALRDAITGAGAGAKTLADLANAIAAVQARDVSKWGGVAQTGADLTPLFQNLDIALSALRDALKGAGGKDLSTVETAIALVLTEATFTGRLGEVQADPTANTVLARLKDIHDRANLLLADATFTGRLGEVQADPTANTVLGRLKDVDDVLTAQLDIALSALRDALKGASAKDFSTLQTTVDNLSSEQRERTSEGQLVWNGDIEDGGADPIAWNKSVSGAEWVNDDGYLSSKCLRLNTDGASADWRSETFRAKASSTYLIRGKVKGTGDADTKLTIRFFDAADTFLSEVDIALNQTYADWTEVRDYAAAPVDTAKADVMFRVTGTGTADIKGDRFFVKEV